MKKFLMAGVALAMTGAAAYALDDDHVRQTRIHVTSDSHATFVGGDGQIVEAHSISAGLDYPGVGPEHAFWRDAGRAEFLSCTDKEALEAFQLCTRLEGIIPALEPSHALAHVSKVARDYPKDHLLVMNLCGRGDKDIFAVAKHLGLDMGQTDQG